MASDPRAPSYFSRLQRKLWTTAFGRDSWVRRHGSLREQERCGLLDRAHYAYGILRAADVARFCGKKAVTVCEFGVANGDGLINMVTLAEKIGAATDMKIRVVGFDTGAGLPEVRGHKDHPELWSGGDFGMQNRDALLARIAGRAQLIFGDIADTVSAFAEAIDSEAPLGFVVIDVDIYSASRSALRALLADPRKYCPAISMYFDDVAFYFANEWCGELASIQEFNEENDRRKIGIDRSLPGGRPPWTDWYKCMYVAHILDHPLRSRPRSREELTIGAHHEFMSAYFLY